MPPLQRFFDRVSQVRFPTLGTTLKSEVHLRAGDSRRPKQRRVEPVALDSIQTQTPMRDLEPASDELGDRPGSPHARSKVRVIITSAAHILDQ
jgi:hypothetical protein